MPGNKPEVVGPGGFGPIQFPEGFKVPGKLAGVGIALLAVIVLTAVIFNTCFTYVRPNEFGIKQVNIGILTSKGIKKEVYEPGLVFRMPFGFEMIHRLPRHVQVLDMVGNPSRLGMKSYTSEATRKIRTSDGFLVDVDVSILYHIEDPYLVITGLGPGDQYLRLGILPNADNALKEALGELTTEQFYNSPLRAEKADLARDLMDAEVVSKGMRVDHVLIRYFEYTEEIQRNIEEKKLQDQMVFKNQAQARAAREEAQVKRIIQEGEAQVKITLEEGEAYKVRKDAERDLYVRKNKAQADLLVELAEAKREELRNTAMQSMGAERAVAMKMAEVLSGLETIIVPVGGAGGMNPLDLNQIISMFGGHAGGVSGATAEAEVSASPDFQELFGDAQLEEEK